jgi:hypothetical protein
MDLFVVGFYIAWFLLLGNFITACFASCPYSVVYWTLRSVS